VGHKPTFQVTYWGTTGSLPAPLRPAEITDKLVEAIQLLLANGTLNELGPTAMAGDIRRCLDRHLPFSLRSGFGCNTTCVEVQTPDSLLILDAGSGFRELGIELTRRWNAEGDAAQRTAHILLTHAHMDHTLATPFFDPYFDPRNNFTMCGPKLALDSLHVVLDPDAPLRGVYFPPAYDLMRGIRGFRTLEAGNDFPIGDTRIRIHSLNHPGGCLGYRFEQAGRVVVFATDHEQTVSPDQGLVEFARGADLFYADAQYLQKEYDGEVGICGERPLARRGWGHTTVEGCILTAVAAGVRRLHLGHREPKRDDVELERIERYAQEKMREALAAAGRPTDSCTVEMAREGTTVVIG
jgi:phosphoribosyl 1,2-cyclic phosphodiesterase